MSFESDIRNEYLNEATVALAELEKYVLTLETNSEDPSILKGIFRIVHNLKGGANAVLFTELGHFIHELESFLSLIRSGTLTVQPATVNLLLRCNDHLSKMIEMLKQDHKASLDYSDLLKEIQGQSTLSHQPSEGSGDPAIPASPATPAQIPPLSNPENQPRPPILQTNREESSMGAGSETIRVNLARVERLINFMGEIVILETVLKEQVQTFGHSLLDKTIHQLGKVTREAQDIAMSLRMVPLSTTFQKMHRIVRDTAAALDKQVQLVTAGDNTEIDKTILEKLSDPLVHLIRNAVDHGIETKEIRKNLGKKEIGQIALSAYHQSGNLMIEIRDDGAGLDPARLRSIAIQKGIITSEIVLTEEETFALIYRSGFSTRSEVTDISGRGVGMDVVKNSIEQLQGDLHIESQIGSGTLFKIRVPLTLAIVEAMIIRCGSENFIIPLSHVHEVIQPSKQDLHFASGIGEILTIRGEHLPLYSLSYLLRKTPPKKPTWETTAIIVKTLEQPFAVSVDDILTRQQVVVKKLGAEHRHLKGFSGSAILGNGRPALILELADLVENSKKFFTKQPEYRI